MPLNILRLNHAASSHPNERVVFIKPLPRPPALQSESETADTFLRAIAAQCLPIMKVHHLSVTTLEEHEPNREFIGRNFNNGEIIQLVLRSKSGGWLPFNMVQMVMMHELAHNTHMNHGKGFWQVRNEYAGEMRQLWAKAYTGEGFWGSGRRLQDVESVMGNNVVGPEELRDLPVCGGTYRSRRRKRKPKQELTWKEKRDRRIEKKFGKNGVSLGEDEDKRMMLEIGKKGPIGGKPRVAQSNRGRELRAAAALSRFETNKKEVEELKEEEIKGEEEDQSADDSYEELDSRLEDARDVDGQRLLDRNGNAMIRVCGDTNDDTDADAYDAHVKQEMDELSGLERYFPRIPPRNGEQQRTSPDPRSSHNATPTARSRPPGESTTLSPSPSMENTPDEPPPLSSAPISKPSHLPLPTSHAAKPTLNSDTPKPSNNSNPPPPLEILSTTSMADVPCSICSLSNPSLLLTCGACAHVLHPSRDTKHWSCPSASCTKIGYTNAGDSRVCGLCGVRKT